jgi:D-glycerate 3-kinase
VSKNQLEDLSRFVAASREEIAHNCGIEESIVSGLLPWALPLAADLAQRQANRVQEKTPKTLIVGIQGPQGSGKSTLVALLRHLLIEGLGLRTACLSIDDLYLTRAERSRLAADVHPLFQTRGVPGTHDPALGVRTIQSLAQPGVTAVPRFEKTLDDRSPEPDWPRVEGPCDVVLFEGLWIGLEPMSAAQLADKPNALESSEDADGRWRAYANDALAGDYKELFALCQVLVHLKVPDFGCVQCWRGGAETELWKAMEAQGKSTDRLMDAAALDRFFLHYERFTAHAMRTMPAKADIMLTLDREHQIVASSVPHD